MENSISEGKSRLGWFDAMRGLAIVLVVLGHVLQFSLNLRGDYDSILLRVICMFHMPLFFLISGFFGYKACESWTLPRLGDFIKRKIQALIICAVVFFGLYNFCHGGNAFAWVYNGFGGYWFTIVLFQAFVVFLVLSLLSKLFKSERILEIGLILVSLVSFLGGVKLQLLDDSTLWRVLCTKSFCIWFQFFALGIFCRKYQTVFESLLSKNWFKAGITICAVVYLVQRFQPFIPIHLPGEDYAMLLVVVAFFFTKREFFEKQNATSSTLRYIGRRTLDIYMIHYFFIPDLSVLTEWIAPNSMFIFQLTIGLVVSALIIAVCLLLSDVLRLSNFLSAWLFGVKIKRRE